MPDAADVGPTPGPSSGPFPDKSPDTGPGVILPTTAGPLTIKRLKRRRRLPGSYVALAGDYRPLRISTDYDRFVKGPLQAVLAEQIAFELILDGDIDCGRSWELPVLIAHWLERGPEQGRERGPERAGGGRGPLIWATGMVDADLRPQPADYEIARKLAASKPRLDAWRAEYGSIVALLPPATGPEAEAEVRAGFAAEGIAVHFIGDFAALDRVLAEITGRAPSGRIEAPQPHPAPGPEGQEKSAPSRAWLIVAAVLPFVAMGSALSTLIPEPTDGPAFQLGGLHAEDRTECIAKILSGAHFESHPAKITAGGFALEPGQTLCGLRFRNPGAAPIELTLDPGLTGRGIAGSAARMVLAPGGARDFYFARPPKMLQAAADVAAPGAPARQWSINLQ